MKYIPKGSREYNRNKTLNMIHDRLRGLTYGQLAVKYNLHENQTRERVLGIRGYPNYIIPITIICFITNRPHVGTGRQD